MAKGNNKGAKSAAEKAAEQQAAPSVKKNSEKTSGSSVQVIQMSDLEKVIGSRTVGGLDPNRTADVLTGLRSMFFENKTAAQDFKVPEDSVKEINRLTAQGYVALFATAIVLDNTPFAIAMRHKELEPILKAATDMGVNINIKALPAPNEGEQVVVPSSAIEIPDKVKEEIRNEQAIANEKVVLDPTKIENEDALKKSIIHILVKGNGSENLYDKIATAINFYESYLGIQAGKSEDPDAARAALKEKSRCNLLSEIANMLGTCPFIARGAAKYMFEETQRTASPITAFCTLRAASLNANGAPKIEDQLVADIVKVLVRWYADTQIAESKRVLEGFERDIEILKKDAKKNAKGIEDGNKKIENVKQHIKDIEAVVTIVNMPDREVVDKFVENYTDSNQEGYKFARMMGAKILDNYYGDVKPKEIKPESLTHNLQQYAGVITNMFLPPLNRITQYSEANITELEKLEGKAEEKAEEKNA